MRLLVAIVLMFVSIAVAYAVAYVVWEYPLIAIPVFLIGYFAGKKHFLAMSSGTNVISKIRHQHGK